MDCLTIGDYTVTFDEQGASIERKRTGAIYRIIAVTATNAIDFMRHHRTLCFAMMKNRPEDLAAYKLYASSEKLRNGYNLLPLGIRL